MQIDFHHTSTRIARKTGFRLYEADIVAHPSRTGTNATAHFDSRSVNNPISSAHITCGPRNSRSSVYSILPKYGFRAA